MAIPDRCATVMLLSQAVCILFYGLFVRYDAGINADTSTVLEVTQRSALTGFYPLYTDLHVMVFVGFTFVLTFVKHYNWSAVGFGFLVACWALQITILCYGFWYNVCIQYYNEQDFKKIYLNMQSLSLADYGAVAVLVSFGAILGKCNIF